MTILSSGVFTIPQTPNATPWLLQVPSDTFFTTPPHFTWWIVLYFFVGGISGGALMVASLLRLFGGPEDRAFIRLGVYLSFIGLAVSAIVLIVDLTLPLRFWHMLVQNNTGRVMFKWWSPMSIGAWGLLVFGFFCGMATLRALRDDKRLTWSTLEFLDRAPVSKFGAIGGIFGGLFLAGYTGVLLSVSNRPIWADSTWVGLLFLLSGISTSVAALLLLARYNRLVVASTEARLKRFDQIALMLELVVLIAFVVSLGNVATAFLNRYGILLLLGVVVVGILMPLQIGRGGGWLRSSASPRENVVSASPRESVVSASPRENLVSAFPCDALVTASVLVLFGGFVLRYVVLFASEQYYVAGAQVFR